MRIIEDLSEFSIIMTVLLEFSITVRKREKHINRYNKEISALDWHSISPHLLLIFNFDLDY